MDLPLPPRTEGRLTAVFTKHPTPGRVKTRLVPPLTPLQAADLAEAMLRDTVARCTAARFRTVLVFSPPEEERWFRATFPEIAEREAQRGTDLGARLANFVDAVFVEERARTLVVVGSDQPLVPRACLEQAHALLEDGADCVLGPDPGGGYHLIGLSRSVPELFTEVAMSNSGMCAATEELARRRGLRVARLDEHLDVDVEADLARLRAALANPGRDPASPDDPRHTRRFLAELSLP